MDNTNKDQSVFSSIIGKHAIDRTVIEKYSNIPTYTIGVDTLDRNNLAYCLVLRNPDETIRFLLTKSMSDSVKFWEEVNNLVKYFDAQLITD